MASAFFLVDFSGKIRRVFFSFSENNSNVRVSISLRRSDLEHFLFFSPLFGFHEIAYPRLAKEGD